MTDEIKKKLSSRKFWCMVAGFVTGVALFFQGDPTVTVGGVVMSLGSIVAYVLGESWVDASNAASNTTNITGELSQAEAKKLVQ